ncbi:hypothetical protein EDD29_1128 [Actinocorallia herbida]|uniref:Uncharacterized protein n=1 Tax=Actinocorallia herbida TaxID=58109 RepID=A0A3N1CQP7_9ACTN|nr:hypothetical protein EDD29_1128 [Actinocorallia herbida]
MSVAPAGGGRARVWWVMVRRRGFRVAASLCRRRARAVGRLREWAGRPRRRGTGAVPLVGGRAGPRRVAVPGCGVRVAEVPLRLRLRLRVRVVWAGRPRRRRAEGVPPVGGRVGPWCGARAVMPGGWVRCPVTSVRRVGGPGMGWGGCRRVRRAETTPVFGGRFGVALLVGGLSWMVLRAVRPGNGGRSWGRVLPGRARGVSWKTGWGGDPERRRVLCAGAGCGRGPVGSASDSWRSSEGERGSGGWTTEAGPGLVPSEPSGAEVSWMRGVRGSGAARGRSGGRVRSAPTWVRARR